MAGSEEVENGSSGHCLGFPAGLFSVHIGPITQRLGSRGTCWLMITTETMGTRGARTKHSAHPGLERHSGCLHTTKLQIYHESPLLHSSLLSTFKLPFLEITLVLSLSSQGEIWKLWHGHRYALPDSYQSQLEVRRNKYATLGRYGMRKVRSTLSVHSVSLLLLVRSIFCFLFTPASRM